MNSTHVGSSKLVPDDVSGTQYKIMNDAQWSSHVGALMFRLMDHNRDHVNLTAGECSHPRPSIIEVNATHPVKLGNSLNDALHMSGVMAITLSGHLSRISCSTCC